MVILVSLGSLWIIIPAIALLYGDNSVVWA